ncbi:MAG: class I SAM-dependent methyltransferase [Solirubrobacterales bacterium]
MSAAGEAPGPEEELAIPGEDVDRLAVAEIDAAYRWAAPAVVDRHVLVAGCGRGHGAQILLEAGAKSVVGVDSDPRSVEIATRLYGDRIPFLVAETVGLPLAAASFDAVICFDSREATLDPAAAIAELGRVLADGGVLLVSLPLSSSTLESPSGDSGGAEKLRELLDSGFKNVLAFRRRLSIAATVAPEDAPGAVAVEHANWLTGGEGEGRTLLVAASDSKLPDFSSLASMISFRDLRAHQDTLEAWEERARMAEADGSAKHWELVASREAQRRLRMRLHALEHRPLRVISRVLRGKPAKLGEGPPLRVSETKLQRWD